MSKKDLLAEAAALGIKGVDEGTLNRSLQELIDTAKANAARADASEPVWEDIIPDSDDAAEIETVPVTVKEEPTFTLEQLQPYAEELFGVGGHVLVGAQSAGTIPAGKMTKAEAQAGVDQYLSMPVEQVRRD